MDFKELINKESFKAILLHHLKSQAKQNLGNIIAQKIEEKVSSNETPPSEDIIDEVSKNIIESSDFPEFSSRFLENLERLLEDKDNYVPKEERRDNVSQCSSASSVNTSSIDFLSPNQFQNAVQCLKNGTNVEKLEAIETMHRLPTMEHLTNKSFWPDVEQGLHSCLSSKVLFLRAASLKLFTKMLTSSESKVVQDSYLSLIRYISNISVSSLKPSMTGTDSICLFRSQFELITLFNRFLQTVSAHWLRYPQSVIENISAQSLRVLSQNSDDSFPVWTCFAVCDPSAKWVRSVLSGHISKAAFLIALEKEPSILDFCISSFHEFISGPCNSIQNCCQNYVFIAKITHLICFINNLLQYSDGKNLFENILSKEIASCWIEVLDKVMQCAHKLCRTACFSCCISVCNATSELWNHFWTQDITPEVYDDLVKILISSFYEMSPEDLNVIYFASQCLNQSFDGILCVSRSFDLNMNFCDFVIRILTLCETLCLEFNLEYSNDIQSSMHVLNSIVILVKNIFSSPSILFLNRKFTASLRRWWLTTNDFYHSKVLKLKSVVDDRVSESINATERSFLGLNISVLRKHNALISGDLSSLETSLNILLEKLLTDIRTNKCVCPRDIASLSFALNSDYTFKQILNKTIVFRLSSVVWHVYENDESCTVASLLQMLVPSIFCDISHLDLFASGERNDPRELQLMQNIFLSAKLASDYVTNQDYSIIFLQVLALLSWNFGALCCLEAKFKVSELLLGLQLHHETIEEKPIIDPEFILRNYILVKLYALGGPGEVILPDQELLEDEKYTWPCVYSYPIHETFYKNLPNTDIISSESVEELQLNDLQKVYLNHLKISDRTSSEFVYQVLQRSSNLLNTEYSIPNYSHSLLMEDADYHLQPEEIVGIALVKRYGILLNLVDDEDTAKLEQFLKAGKCLTVSESNRIDVFICTLYLMFREDIDSGWCFLQSFVRTSNSFYVWFAHSARSSTISESHDFFHNALYEMCDLIIKQSLPSVFSTLQFSGVRSSELFSYWTMLCYWNYLDFEEISHFILLNVLFSGMFSIYFFASILKHLQSYILLNAHNSDLINDLKGNPIARYKIGDYIDYIFQLSDHFGDLETKYLSPLLKVVD